MTNYRHVSVSCYFGPNIQLDPKRHLPALLFVGCLSYVNGGTPKFLLGQTDQKQVIWLLNVKSQRFLLTPSLLISKRSDREVWIRVLTWQVLLLPLGILTDSFPICGSLEHDEGYAS